MRLVFWKLMTTALTMGAQEKTPKITSIGSANTSVLRPPPRTQVRRGTSPRRSLDEAVGGHAVLLSVRVVVFERATAGARPGDGPGPGTSAGQPAWSIRAWRLRVGLVEQLVQVDARGR